VSRYLIPVGMVYIFVRVTTSRPYLAGVIRGNNEAYFTLFKREKFRDRMLRADEIAKRIQPAVRSGALILATILAVAIIRNLDN